MSYCPQCADFIRANAELAMLNSDLQEANAALARERDRLADVIAGMGNVAAREYEQFKTENASLRAKLAERPTVAMKLAGIAIGEAIRKAGTPFNGDAAEAIFRAMCDARQSAQAAEGGKK